MARCLEGRERSHGTTPRPRLGSARRTAATALQPIPTPETKQPALPSRVRAFQILPGTALPDGGPRVQYSDGRPALSSTSSATRQALSNPYTGRAGDLRGALTSTSKPPLINEDGEQRRDFRAASPDVAQACRLALEVPGAAGHAFNVGSGVRTIPCARSPSRWRYVLGKEHIAPEIVGKCRVGDIRNCFADISRSPRKFLGYEPRVSLARTA